MEEQKDINIALAKIEANMNVLQACAEHYKFISRAKAILIDAGLSADEISEFVKERKQAAEMMLKVYSDYRCEE